jgi:hypothetical protein
MPRQCNRVVLTFTDGSSVQLSDANAQLFQELMTEAVGLLPEQKKFKFHNLPWANVKVTATVRKLKRD